MLTWGGWSIGRSDVRSSVTIVVGFLGGGGGGGGGVDSPYSYSFEFFVTCSYI